ncbi:MAG: molybdenum cofactor biosynthesis protein MoaE [Thermodesulfobacteriota bacterium]|nr:molybdenum cofactor biosynthesis protein MoaE [Thermodesulfobacteriota bacterium]
MIEITNRDIDPKNMFDVMKKKTSGSVVFHYAIVKAKDSEKKTLSLNFKVKGDLEGEMMDLERNLRKRWPVEDVLLIRRIGELAVGDIISLAAASAEHRDSAFGLCQEAIDCFKKMRYIHKEEIFEDN